VTDDVLDLFHPAIVRWFRESFAEPTPSQTGGWPAIARGENTLIHAPTGSGKTLAAFLYAIHELITRPGRPGNGVHTLYISPLKALANDIQRNLSGPLDGIRRCASAMGFRLPEVTVGLRTGDTPPSERRKMVAQPPDLLITTPESLHLVLTSPKARETLKTVRYVIVDEIHSLVPNKRGTFLALLLERLEARLSESPIRIGLSGTQRPLELSARFLGGFREDGGARSVCVVDAGMRKRLDLRVLAPVEDMKALPRSDEAGPTVWPAVHELLLDLASEHASTLIFANNRRLVERLAAEMNRLAGHDLVRAHHGSVSKEKRLEIERQLKEGKLPALVATSSLELGIDIGAIDLVCQVETPVSVASALQRVGRAGHLYRETSKGRLVPKTRDDLLRMAGVVRSMRRGEISAVRAPENPLDVLAQQIVAMVALDSWTVDDLYARVRQAYPYRALPREVFTNVLELVSGRYQTPTVTALRPRISWDRTRQVLEALPGSRHTVILNGGTIPESGQYAMVLEDGKTKLGELDEEFVFERRLGQTILLGTSRWRILEIGSDRVIVAPSEEAEAVMPFWKGEGLGHDVEFGARLGRFVRECEERLDAPDFESWIASECALEDRATRNLSTYLRDQRSRGGVLPNDRTVLVDLFRNEAGDQRIALLTPFGRSFHLALLLALQGRLREDGLPTPEAVFSNVGILLRPGRASADAIVQAIRSLRASDVAERVTLELEQTPFFAFRFRRNASRALLLPRARPGRRTPLWLQRLRSHDLLTAAKNHADFPIIAETYREVCEDLLPIDALRRFLESVEAGNARIAVRRDRHPSPFAAALLLEFTAGYLYREDVPAPSGRAERLDRAGLLDLLRESAAVLPLDADALKTFDERLQGLAPFERARDGVELVELLKRIGDLTENEIRARSEGAAIDAFPELVADGRVVPVRIEGVRAEARWVAAEDRERYERWSEEDLRDVVRRFAANRAGASRSEILHRYPGSEQALDALIGSGILVEVDRESGGACVADPDVIAGVRRMTLASRRRRRRPVMPATFSRAVIRRHGLPARLAGDDGLREALGKLAGCYLPTEAWSEILSGRLDGFRDEALDRLVRDGAFIWCGRGGRSGTRFIAFARPEEGWILGMPTGPLPEAGTSAAVLECLEGRGASFLHQLAADLGEPPSELAGTLWDLIWDGWVTNDSLIPAFGPRPDPARWQGHRATGWGGGRWSRRPSAAAGDREEQAWGAVRLLLDRYGVLTRDLVERDSLAIRWREAGPILSRMEWRGEVDRGLFVDGLTGLQFATSGMSSILAGEEPECGELLLVGACDPANVWGDVISIERPDGTSYSLRHHAGNGLVMRDGRPVLAVENHGDRLVPLVDLDASTRREALRKLERLVSGTSARTVIRVRTWDGAPIVDTPVADELERMGFMREDRIMILYRSFGDAT